MKNAIAALALAATTSLAALALAAPAATAQDTLDRSDVETIVREYILANPELLEEAFTALQEQRQAEAEQARTASVAENRDALVNSEHGMVIGNPDGDVTLVEFFDYNCGYCRRAMGDVMRLIETDPNLRVVLKEFPVLGQGSMEAAAVSIMVSEVAPDRFFDFHTKLMDHEGQADLAAALALADEMGLPRAEIEAGMRSEAVREAVEESYGLADALGLSGTPSFVVGNQVEFGAVGYEALLVRVNEARCGATTC